MRNVKFILKCILALLPIIAVVLYTALFPYGYMDKEYAAWDYTKDISHGKLTGKSITSIEGTDGPTAVFSAGKVTTPSTLIIGDSRAMAALVPECIDDKTVNLAVGGATSIEMYYTLNTYLKNNATPEKIIIMFAPFHYTIIDNFWTRAAYFNYLSVADMAELYDYAKAADSETLLKKGYKNDLLSYRLRFPDKYLPALINSKLYGRNAENKAEYANIIMNSGYGEFGTLDGCSDHNYETNYEEMHSTGDAVLIDIYMNKLLKLCADNDINTYFAIPPMNRSSYELLHEDYVSELYSYIEALSVRYPSVHFDKEIPMYEDEFFGDSSHLNNRGAKLFTEEFISSH